MENRMELIYNAASHLFINKGYARTQMKDIAKKINLSTGMLYVYFTGKKDILNFIMKGTIDRSFITRDFALPVTSDLFSSLDDEIKEAFEFNAESFASHMNDLTVYPLEQMFSDAFDIIAKYAVGCLMIEKNPDDLKKLAGCYRQYRSQFFQQMLAYVNKYIEAGSFRKVEYPQYCTRAIIEHLSWWGMHIMNDAFEVDKNISLETAKSVCLDNLVHAYQC